jgi:Xaa-Pro aminopeptidase
VPDIKAIQTELRAAKLDGWLFYDFHHRDPIAQRVLALDPNAMATRRWFYLIPAKGAPRKLVHRIESATLDSLPGSKLLYAGREELQGGLKKLVAGTKTLAMQYSPHNAIPYVSMVDAGTVELIRSLKRKVVSSADLVQRFEACWTAAQLDSHFAAGRVIDAARAAAFAHAAEAVRSGNPISEYDLQQSILELFRAGGVVTEEPPIVAVNAHAGDPHYEPKPQGSSAIKEGDLLLLDMWGKMAAAGSVYYDITWMGYLGANVPDKYARVFEVVRLARDAAISFVQRSLGEGKQIQGWQVDDTCRDVIRKAGFGKYFVHRTGHSIGTSVHGNGANMDGLETLDVRRIIPHTCFSIEPGIYLRDFGVRTEINLYAEAHGASVTGAIQSEILPLLA